MKIPPTKHDVPLTKYDVPLLFNKKEKYRNSISSKDQPLRYSITPSYSIYIMVRGNAVSLL